jgi:hypothetical protein
MIDKKDIDPVRHGGAGLRTFINIAALWQLTDEEQALVLNVGDRLAFGQWKIAVQAQEAIAIPMDVIVRIGRVLSIYASLVTLFPDESHVAAWPRGRVHDTVFCGETPLSYMTTGDLADLDRVVKYLLGLIHGQ